MRLDYAECWPPFRVCNIARQIFTLFSCCQFDHLRQCDSSESSNQISVEKEQELSTYIAINSRACGVPSVVPNIAHRSKALPLKRVAKPVATVAASPFEAMNPAHRIALFNFIFLQRRRADCAEVFFLSNFPLLRLSVGLMFIVKVGVLTAARGRTVSSSRPAAVLTKPLLDPLFSFSQSWHYL